MTCSPRPEEGYRAGRVRARDALWCPGHRVYFAADDFAALVGDNPGPGDPLVVQDVVELEHAADRKEQRIARVETQRVSLAGADDQHPVPNVPTRADRRRRWRSAGQSSCPPGLFCGMAAPGYGEERPAPTVIG